MVSYGRIAGGFRVSRLCYLIRVVLVGDSVRLLKMRKRKTLEERVSAERAAHESQDVLAESYRLKDRFPHIWGYPSRKRLESAIAEYVHSIDGKTVLDYGCGRGEESLKYLENGAVVYGIDIAKGYVEAAADAAKRHGYAESRYRFEIMDAHSLAYPDNTFDLIIGRGILHHLDAQVAFHEVYRVLKPGGRVLMYEPLRGGLLLRLFRSLTPRARTVDERPFSKKDILRITGDEDWQTEMIYCGVLEAPMAILTSLIMRDNPENGLLAMIDRIESWLHRRQWFEGNNQYVLFNMTKRQ